MPPKPSFCVKLLSSQHENAPAATSIITFVLPGTLAEDNLQSKILKMHLSEWNLNISNYSSLPGPSSTSILYGMPTLQTPLNMLGFGDMTELRAGATDNVVDEAVHSHWMAPEVSFPL
jgi:hypothetical protein